MSFLTIENYVGAPVAAANQQIYPVSRVVRVAAPGMPGGLTWSRPYRVLVQDAQGQMTTHPITDITRQAQIFFLGLAMLTGLAWWLVKRLTLTNEEK